MKRQATLFLIILLTFTSASAQFQASSRKVQFEPLTFNPNEGQLNKKSPSAPRPCDEDTLDYARYKASGLIGIAVSKGYSLGQYFDAPDTVTVSGFEFYAWASLKNSDSIPIYCHIYAPSSDSLPTGLPIRSDTVYVDSTFGGGVIANMAQFASWKPYKTTQPFILVVSSDDTNRVSIVTNSYSSRDGDNEGLACGSVGGTWYNALNLNIGGKTLDCDIALEPFVKYKVYNDFKFTDCYNYKDTVKLTNTSSDLFFSPMYNRYKIFGLGRYCHRWDFGNGFFQTGQTEDAFTIYPNAQNKTLRMVSTLIQMRNTGRCNDTTIKELKYQPKPISFNGIPGLICSGDSVLVYSGSDADVYWYNNYTDTQAFYKGLSYQTPPLTENDTFFARSYNDHCISTTKQLILRVKEKPRILTTRNDSICLNTSANLSATTSAGTLRWYADSLSSNVLFEGNVYQVGPLKNDTLFFVDAINDGCITPQRFKIHALVSSDFAPAPPKTIQDTTICLGNGSIFLSASSGNTIRWFNVPSGGSPDKINPLYVFTPTQRGTTQVYVDAFDGTCASTRIPVRIQVNHFATVSEKLLEYCENDTALLDYSELFGDLSWFDENKDYLFESKYEKITKTGMNIYFIQPHEGNCRDTVMHKVQVNIEPTPLIDVLSNPGACRGTAATIQLQGNGKTYSWYEENGTPIKQGNSFTTLPLYLHTPFRVRAQVKNCYHDTVIIARVLPIPNANFDYSIIEWRRVRFVARDKNLASYLWDMDDLGTTYTSTQFEHTFSKDGDYKIQLIGTSADGCKDTISKPVSLDTYSIGELSDKLLTYPNPTNGKVYYDLTTGEAIRSIRVIGSNGQVWDVQLNGEHFIDLSTYSAGIYTISIETKSGIYLQRITKY